MELNDADFNKALDAKIIDERLEGLQWITYEYMDNPKYELMQLIKSKSYIENSKFNYILITDYQYLPMILNLKTVSPAKWYDAMSVPDINSVYHKNFKEFFTKNLKEQQISFAYLIGKGRWPLETLFKSDGCIKFQKINEIMILSDLRECIDN